MESSNEKRRTNIVPILLGVVVLLLIVGAIAVGFFYSSKTADQVFESGINKVADKIIKQLDEEEDLLKKTHFNENDLSYKGTFSFDTSLDLKEWNALKKLKYQIEMNVSSKNNYEDVKASILENEKEILAESIILHDKKGYIEVPKVLPSVLEFELEPEKDLAFIEVIEEIFKNDLDMEKYKELANDIRDIFIKSIDKTKINILKDVIKDYNGKEAKTIEYSYTFDSKNEQELKDSLQKLLEEYAEDNPILSTLLNQIFSNLLDGEKDLKIVVTTTGVLHDVIEIDFIKEGTLSYIDYNGQQTISFGEYLVGITTDGKDLLIIIQNKDDSITIRINEELDQNQKEIKYKVVLDGKIKNETYHLDLDLIVNYGIEVSIEEITNTKKMEDLTSDEMTEIYINFLAKLKDTALEDILNQYITGLA